MIEISEHELILSARISVLKRAIGALIVTHPDPEKFAEKFGATTGLAQIEHLTAPGATDATKRAASAFAREILGLAADEIARRPRRTDGGG